MTIHALLSIPIAVGLLSQVLPGRRSLVALSGLGAAAQLGLALDLLARTARGVTETAASGFFRADVLSAWMTLVVSLVALAAAVYSGSYIEREVAQEPGLDPARRRGRMRHYFALFNLFIATMIFVCVVNNLGYLWVAIEATTLVSVFLVGFSRSKTSVEAAWKYLILCSVGIAFALVGTILIYYTSVRAMGPKLATLDWSDLAAQAPRFHPYLVRLSFVFVLLGYGTKAGLAPLHAWLPDAHSEAPTPVSALLSGVLLKCALYGILRYHMISISCQGPGFSEELLRGFGLLSIVIAALFIVTQRHVKRLLAYSSLEHVGIIATAFGFGGPLGAFGGLFHMLNHALTKSLLFMAAGTIAEAHGTKSMDRIRGAGETQPVTAAIFFAGALALAGMPLTSVFLSELMILRAGLLRGHAVGAVVMLLGLVVVFAGLIGHVSQMVLGRGRRRVHAGPPRWDATLPPLVLLGLVVALGIVLPRPVVDVITAAAALVGRP